MNAGSLYVHVFIVTHACYCSRFLVVWNLYRGVLRASSEYHTDFYQPALDQWTTPNIRRSILHKLQKGRDVIELPFKCCSRSPLDLSPQCFQIRSPEISIFRTSVSAHLPIIVFGFNLSTPCTMFNDSNNIPNLQQHPFLLF